LHQITDHSLEPFASCKQSRLSSLHVSYTSITDSGMGYLAQGCPLLHMLEISSCDNITNQGLKHLANGCHKLHALIARHCKQIGDNGLKHLARGCPNLNTASFYMCDLVSDMAVYHISRHCEQLQALNISGCQITNASLSYLAEGCKNLRVLNARYVPVTLPHFLISFQLLFNYRCRAGASGIIYHCPKFERLLDF